MIHSLLSAGGIINYSVVVQLIFSLYNVLFFNDLKSQYPCQHNKKGLKVGAILRLFLKVKHVAALEDEGSCLVQGMSALVPWGGHESSAVQCWLQKSLGFWDTTHLKTCNDAIQEK